MQRFETFSLLQYYIQICNVGRYCDYCRITPKFATLQDIVTIAELHPNLQHCKTLWILQSYTQICNVARHCDYCRETPKFTTLQDIVTIAELHSNLQSCKILWLLQWCEWHYQELRRDYLCEMLLPQGGINTNYEVVGRQSGGIVIRRNGYIVAGRILWDLYCANIQKQYVAVMTAYNLKDSS